MGLGTTTGNKIYLNVKDGKIVKREPQGGESLFSFVEGNLTGITKREREFNGERVPFWFIDIQDPDGGDIYTMAINYRSGLALSIFNSLASAEDPTRIKIEVTKHGDFTRATVYNRGEKLTWKYTEIPPTEEVNIGGRTVKNDSNRMALVEKMVAEIVDRIKMEMI